MNRRELLAASAAAAVVGSLPLSAADAQTTPATSPTTAAIRIPDDLVWHDVREWGVEGKGFADTEAWFDRLPARAQPIVRGEVWNLSRCTAGMSAHFEADSPAFFVRYEVTGASLAMPHMPATGMSGLDLYAKTNDSWRWLATHQPREKSAMTLLQDGIAPGRRAYHINLPLYNGVKLLEIGVPKAATFEPVPPRTIKPILFYGTSITQGACASRPGMAFLNILARRLNRPILNFGFSGNGRMELEVARFLAELEPAIFVIDCVANTTPDEITERTGPLVKLLRDSHPAVPIQLMEDRTWDNAILLDRLTSAHRQKRAALRRAFDDLLAAGVGNLHYRRGDDLLGSDGEGTVDGSHPNDLGMMRYADALEPDLRKLLH